MRRSEEVPADLGLQELTAARERAHHDQYT
jgi:hypothetical protein